MFKIKVFISNNIGIFVDKILKRFEKGVVIYIQKDLFRGC